MTLTRALAQQAQELVARMTRLGYKAVFFLSEPHPQGVEMVLSGIRQGERREICCLARNEREVAKGIAHFERVIDEVEKKRRRTN